MNIDAVGLGVLCLALAVMPGKALLIAGIVFAWSTAHACEKNRSEDT